MRASVIVPLMLAALFGLGLRYGSSSSQSAQASRRSDRAHAAPPAAQKSTKPETKPLWEKQVKGAPCIDEKKALNSALREAGWTMSAWLKERNPPVEWVPTPDFLRDEKHKIIKHRNTE